MQPTKEELELALKLTENFTKQSPELREKETFLEWTKTTLLEEEGYWWQPGTSKLCLGHKDLNNWIIKIGYTRGRRNYAALEYEKYQLAVEKGLEKYFPVTILLGDICGYTCFLQQKAEVDKYRLRAEWQERLEQAGIDSRSTDMFSMHLEAIRLFFNDQDLIDFLDEYGIGDFHELNFGYINDSLLIIDFNGRRLDKI